MFLFTDLIMWSPSLMNFFVWFPTAVIMRSLTADCILLSFLYLHKIVLSLLFFELVLNSSFGPSPTTMGINTRSNRTGNSREFQNSFWLSLKQCLALVPGARLYKEGWVNTALFWEVAIILKQQFSKNTQFWVDSYPFCIFKRLFHSFLSFMASDEKVAINHHCSSIGNVSAFKTYSLSLAFNNLPQCNLALEFLCSLWFCLHGILYSKHF